MLDFKGGDGRAFEQLFRRYQDAIYGYVRRRVNDPGRAEEITQDVFLALVQHRNGYEVTASFRTYLYRIALNRVSSEYRKKKESDPLPAEAEGAGEDPAVVRQVREALERLESDQREIVLLREYQGLSYEEIARVLGVPVGTVRSRLFRAKLALREILAPSWSGGA
jgi:RNA polymerase sigma-70 factor (ECF subfamily)